MEKKSELQWGRNFLVTEIEVKKINHRFSVKLQWGRNFLVTEIVKITCEKLSCVSFNGAVTFWLRKFDFYTILISNTRHASMGP